MTISDEEKDYPGNRAAGVKTPLPPK